MMLCRFVCSKIFLFERFVVLVLVLGGLVVLDSPTLLHWEWWCHPFLLLGWWCFPPFTTLCVVPFWTEEEKGEEGAPPHKRVWLFLAISGGAPYFRLLWTVVLLLRHETYLSHQNNLTL